MKFFIIFLLFPSSMYAQALHDSMTKKIDQVFSRFTASTPGCAVAVMEKGKVIFAKGYGQANLEYSVPITENTIFHIASISKQYVAFCMLLLEKEGKLSLDDDIRKHLDFLPDFGHKISIRHLIHHTSGLRDQWQLLANAGWQLDDVITQEHVIKLISKQKALNFMPGEEYMYCNTGYTLMAEIVKKVSGLTLREYTDKNIFKPLEMNNTHFHDNYRELVPLRAYSYMPRTSNTYEHAVLSYSIVGATSLFTTVLDHLKWVNNFSTGFVGGKELVTKMFEAGVLNDGRKLDYAFALGVSDFRGWKIIGHGGADAGYRTYSGLFPEKDLAIAVFSNLGTVNTWNLTEQIANMIIKDENTRSKPVIQTKLADTNFVKKMQGKYYSHRGDIAFLKWRDGKLYRGATANEELLIKAAENNRFVTTANGPVFIIDANNQRADSIMEMQVESPVATIHFKRHPSKPQVIGPEFSGRYYSEETEAFYTISEKDGNLSLEHRKFSTVALKNIAPDQFTSPFWWMNHIRFLRNERNKIFAFEVNAGRVMHLRYEKVNSAPAESKK